MKTEKRRGFTLFELLIAITAIGVISSIAVIGISEVNTSMKTQKLERDVATINTAVKIYLSNGGQITGSMTGAQVITKLKTVPKTDNWKQIAGLRDAMLDPRVKGVEMAATEIASDMPRAVWNQSQHRFDVVTTAGEQGFKGFQNDQALLVHSTAFDTEERIVRFKLAKNSNWVWDYTDSGLGGPTSFGPVNTGIASNNPGDLPNTPGGALPLSAPSFDPVGGTYPLGDFFDDDEFPVTINNPNPTGSSQISFTTDGTNWDFYTGQTIMAVPGQTVSARAIAINQNNWVDSGIEDSAYLADPVDLLVGVSVPRNPLTYPEAGGEMVPGSVAQPSAVGPVTVELTNAADLPVRYQNSEDFQVYWTYDGSDPLSSGTASNAGVFTDGFPGANIHYGLDKWGPGADTLTVKVGAKALDTSVVADSGVSMTEIGISKLTLEAPIGDLDPSGSYTANQLVTLSPVAAGGTLPVGWRIYYTTNGDDPGVDANGEPLTGTYYDSPFNVFSGTEMTASIKARVYGPSGYANWFNPSPMYEANFDRWVPPTWSGYVGGLFSNTKVSTYRNIKQHQTDGVIDHSFNPGSGLNDRGRAVVVQPDGKVIAAGRFTEARGETMNRIARFEEDGSLDASFNIGAGANSEILAIALQDDGKILVGGTFTLFNNESFKGLVRLNSDGSIDGDYNVGEAVHSDEDGWVHAIDVQSDGKAIIGGCFSRYNYNTAGSLVRVNTDGSYDASLDTAPGVTGLVHSVKIQPDGKIVIGGGFSRYDGASRANIARVNTDGSNDDAFNPGLGANKDVYTVSLFSDGKIFIGGSFSDVNKVGRHGVARLNADGSVDASYDLGQQHGIPSWIVYASDIDSEGRVITGGNLTNYSPNGAARSAFLRLNTDGTNDTSYTPEALPQHSYIYGIDLRPDDRAVVVGLFPEDATITGANVARLDTETGQVDPTFDVGAGTDDDVNVVLELESGDVLIGGEFDFVDGQDRDQLAKLSADGSVTDFWANNIIGRGEVRALAEQPDGKILVGGSFTHVDYDYRYRRLVRLNADGTVDSSFRLDYSNPSDSRTYGFDDDVWSIAVMPDGSILVGGEFDRYGNQWQLGLVLLNPDGSKNGLYSAANGNIPTTGTVYDIDVLPNGEVIYAGSFSGRVRRVAPNGTPDASFAPAPIDSTVRTLSLMADGRMLIGGFFTNVDGTSCSRVAVLNADGSLHSAFDANSAASDAVYAVASAEDAKALAFGRFDYYKGIYRDGTVRANPDGSVDGSFVECSLNVNRIYTTD